MIKFASVVGVCLLAAACSASRLQQPYDRCNVSQLEWRVLTGEPENAAELLAMTSWRPYQEGERFWFGSADGRLRLCAAPKYGRHSYLRTREGCGSSRSTFEQVDGKWVGHQDTRTPSITICH